MKRKQKFSHFVGGGYICGMCVAVYKRSDGYYLLRAERIGGRQIRGTISVATTAAELMTVLPSDPYNSAGDTIAALRACGYEGAL